VLVVVLPVGLEEGHEIIQAKLEVLDLVTTEPSGGERALAFLECEKYAPRPFSRSLARRCSRRVFAPSDGRGRMLDLRALGSTTCRPKRRYYMLSSLDLGRRNACCKCLSVQVATMRGQMFSLTGATRFE
jgi:hypothetical protein